MVAQGRISIKIVEFVLSSPCNCRFNENRVLFAIVISRFLFCDIQSQSSLFWALHAFPGTLELHSQKPQNTLLIFSSCGTRNNIFSGNEMINRSPFSLHDRGWEMKTRAHARWFVVQAMHADTWQSLLRFELHVPVISDACDGILTSTTLLLIGSISRRCCLVVLTEKY